MNGAVTVLQGNSSWKMCLCVSVITAVSVCLLYVVCYVCRFCQLSLHMGDHISLPSNLILTQETVSKQDSIFSRILPMKILGDEKLLLIHFIHDSNVQDES